MKTKTTNYVIKLVLLLFILSSVNMLAQDTLWWQDWEKHQNNPVIADGGGNWFSNAYDEAVIYDNGIYKMWFTAWETDGIRKIGYAESENGVDWDIHSSPVIQGGPVDAWNHNIYVGSVFRQDDTLRMWYTGSPENNPFYPLIGYAWSINGINWNLLPDEVLNPGFYGFPWTSFAEVYFSEGTYHMYFNQVDKINYATSADGINWVKYANNPVMESVPSTFYSMWILAGGIVDYNDTVHMWFSGREGGSQYDRVGYAWSINNTDWTVYNEPAVDVGDEGSWDDHAAYDAAVLLDDGIFKMWYTGWTVGGNFKIGYATGPPVSTNCLANGMTFSNQQEVDEFPDKYPYCKKIVGDVIIDGDNITNLNGFNTIEAFGGLLKIIGNDSLTNLSGLEHTVSIDSNLHIWGNSILTNLEGLDQLDVIGGELSITSNDYLLNLQGLEKLSTIGGDLKIGHHPISTAGNPSLISLLGIENVDTIYGDLVIIHNKLLDSCHVNSICEYLGYSENSIEISDNATGCDSFEQVDESCSDEPGQWWKNWERCEFVNPVVDGVPGTWKEGIMFPTVLKDNDHYNMWFTGINSTWSGQVGYASSADGFSWAVNTEPIIPFGESGAWDYNRFPGTVLLVDDTLRFLFTGFDAQFAISAIGYAWSLDGFDWNIHPNPVLGIGSPGTWDDVYVADPVVYHDGEMYHLYFNTHNDIRYATSTDGISWELYAGNPVMVRGSDGSFYDFFIETGGLFVSGDTTHMIFTGMDGDFFDPDSRWRLGYAWSTDHKNWTIGNEGVHVFDVGLPGSWDEKMVRFASIIKIEMADMERYLMWYNGSSSTYSIGLACSPDCVGVGQIEFNRKAIPPLTVFPSPFVSEVNISFEIPKEETVTIGIYNLTGQQLKVLINETRQGGKHEVHYNGQELQPGIYFCVLKTESGTQTMKMIKL